MTHVATLMTLLAIASFVLAMVLYGIHLLKTKRPVSYFELRNEGRLGHRAAALAFLFWTTSVSLALIAGVLSLIYFFF